MRMLQLLLPCLLAAAHAQDPRPAILVLADHQGLGDYRGSWLLHLAEAHPEWRIIADVSEGRRLSLSRTVPIMKKGAQVGEKTLPGLADTIAERLSAAGPVGLVLIAVGGNHARQEERATTPIPELAPHLKTVLAAIRSRDPATRIVLMTPLPVMEARLDQWNVKTWEGGAAAAAAIAELIRTQADGATVLDAHAWAMAQADAKGAPGAVIGGTGFLLSSGGHAALGAWLGEQLTVLAPTPTDAAAYAAWEAERASEAALDAALVGSLRPGSSCVAHGAALARLAASSNPKDKALRFTVPRALLGTASLDLLLRPEDGHTAAIAAANAEFGAHPLLRLTVAGQTVELRPALSASRLLDEATPTEPVPGDRYGFNSGKWRPFPVLCAVPGQRRWLLLRFDLSGLAGTPEGDAELAMQSGETGILQRLADGAPAAYQREAPAGAFTVHPVLASDRSWNPLRATWASRDGSRTWTGGEADPALRRTALEAFLTQPHPVAVLERARQALADLP